MPLYYILYQHMIIIPGIINVPIRMGIFICLHTHYVNKTCIRTNIERNEDIYNVYIFIISPIKILHQLNY